LRPPAEYFFEPQSAEELAMITNCATLESYEISPRFRRTVEERIARLERDATSDEAQLTVLNDVDHIRRQMRLVVTQRAEALRMKIFLQHATTRTAAMMGKGNKV
jgi:ribosome-associated translation inhibitor RaiA